MSKLAVAVSWNQSHYMALGGFHPLYSGLLDAAPAGVVINAWDNVAVSQHLAGSAGVARWFLEGLSEPAFAADDLLHEACSAYDRQLTRLLPGDVELFHGVPFPSLSRPFFLHVQSLNTLFAPWLATPEAIEPRLEAIRAHYRTLLAGPWCLGIFSQQPETLLALQAFLGDERITARLFTTTPGLPAPIHHDGRTLPAKPALDGAIFLCVITTQPGADFFNCGGHRALRFWQGFLAAGHRGLLRIVGERPAPDLLAAAGVDCAFVERETGRSLYWCSASQAEVEAVMAGSHILLQPADLLCSWEILRAMSLGCVPVIAAAEGASTLLQDTVHGLAVGCLPSATQPWQAPRRTALEETLMVEELLCRIPALLASPAYAAMQQAGHQRSLTTFTAEAAAHSFWPLARQLYAASAQPASTTRRAPAVVRRRSLLKAQGLRKAWRGEARPRLRIHTGLGSVWSVGGYFVYRQGCPALPVSAWSVLAPYGDSQGQAMVLANTLPELMGCYLPQPDHRVPSGASRLIRTLSRLMMRFPRLHSRASHCLRQLRRLHNALRTTWSLSRGRDGEQPLLVVEGFYGFNIVFYQGLFHAVLQSDGALSGKRLESGRYNHFYSDPDLEVVKDSVVAGLAEMRSALLPDVSIQKGMK